MKIKQLHIKNFKSIVDLTINEPNPFTVFVGPNGSGKSNIFEALEFAHFAINNNAENLFGGRNSFINYTHQLKDNSEIVLYTFEYNNKIFKIHTEFFLNKFKTEMFPIVSQNSPINFEEDGIRRKQFEQDNLNQLRNFNRIFVKNIERQKLNYTDNSKLSFSCNNLEKVLKRLLENKEKREEISEWLELFLPEFDRIEVVSNDLDDENLLRVYHKFYEKPFNKKLISDGTYNIIALLTAVYQSDEPQFLCIEEPENGLHPKVIKQLVNFFRDACEEKGHYIWLNTHSQTLVSVLEPKEIILVDKKNGETKIKQFDKDFDMYGFEMDEAWLSNALGGGLPW